MTKEEYEDVKSIFSMVKSDDIDKVIYESKSKVLMRFFSLHRRNVISWLPISKNDSILEIGGECGVISSYLSDKSKIVDTVIPDRYERIFASECLKHKNNVSVFSTLSDCNKKEYSLVTMIGSLPKASEYFDDSDNEACFKLLKYAYLHLADEGILFAALPNKFGLKYFAGYSEDYTNEVYAGILGNTRNKKVDLFGKNTLLELLGKAGFKKIEFYYPYPDYLFTEEIYSDYKLPKEGDLGINNRDFFGDNTKIFPENYAWNEIVNEGLFTTFSNSFIVLAKK